VAESTSRKSRKTDDDEASVRQRILSAAFKAFREHGYAATSTLEIATRAQVSKATLYALVGNKQEMLAACVREQARHFQIPAELPDPRDRETLARVLGAFGTQLLRELSDPTVIAIFRLAIAEALHAPEVARAVDSIGGETIRTALQAIMVRARSAGLVDGDPAQMARRFIALLWGDLLLGLLLDVAERPGPQDIARRAREATDALLRCDGVRER
jgi:AcrR family transcriptional regulator